MKARAIVTLSNENAPAAFRPSAHPQTAADAALGAAHGRQPGRSARPVPCPPTSQRCSACAPIASIPPAATTAHLSERSSAPWHALRTA
jgi:hypothetical protein